MADFVVDTFTGTNGAHVDARSGETGATWTRVAGIGTDGTDELAITGNELHGIGGNEALYYASGTPATADYSVEVPINHLGVGGNVIIGFMVRMSTDGQNGYRIVLTGFEDELQVYEFVGGTETLIYDEPWTASDHTIRVEVEGTELRLYVNDVLKTTETGLNVTDAGRVGVYKYSTVVPTVDFFRLQGITGSDLGGTGTDAEVTGPVLDAIGDIPTPTVAGDANATVTSPPLDALGSLPTTGMILSVEVVTGPLSALGNFPDPAVTGTGSAEVTSPAAGATADLPAPALLADAAVVSPAADATADLPTPTVTAGSTLTSPALTATGDLKTPGVGEPVDRIRLGTKTTGAVEVGARLTGANEPAHHTGANEPAHTTGGDEVLTNTGALEVAI